MFKPLFVMAIIGTAIGLALPTSKPVPTSGAAKAHSATSSRETVLEREDNGHFYVHAKINGELVRFVVDTGASAVALTEDDAERIGLDVDPDAYEYIGEGASGPVLGQLVTIDEIDVDGKVVDNVSGAVLKGSKLSLLGQSYLTRMGEVQMRGNTMVLR
jgi:aspartyl protease family protein